MTLFKVLVLCAAFAGIQAQANTNSQTNAYLYCENGSIDEVGDRHFSVTLKNDVVTFRPYESSFEIETSKITPAGNGTFVVVNQPVSIWSEGENQGEVLIDAMLTLSQRKNQVFLYSAVSLNKTPFTPINLGCVSKTAE